MLPIIGLRSRNRGKSHVNNYTNRIYCSLFFFLFVFFFTFNEYFLFTRIPMGMVIPGVGSYTATFK